MPSPTKAERFKHVAFTSDQLAYLEHLFPFSVLGPSASEAQIRHYNGQQDVVLRVRERTRGFKPVTPNRDSIPSPG